MWDRTGTKYEYCLTVQYDASVQALLKGGYFKQALMHACMHIEISLFIRLDSQEETTSRYSSADFLLIYIFWSIRISFINYIFTLLMGSFEILLVEKSGSVYNIYTSTNYMRFLFI